MVAGAAHDRPGAHSHDGNVALFHVLAGVASILAGEAWPKAPADSFVRIPANVTHDFENRTDERVGLLNVFPPGGFEENRPAISAWFTGNA
ncbi:cupin domain-containing protein [Shinella sp.]|uniref:cupin domain-containing protein n=1 Tax=Shinella sp. TaxID=1870904 RepID=UPI00301E24E8